MDSEYSALFPFHICTLCDVKFTNKSDLDLHNQLHAGPSGLSCPLCKEILPDLHQLKLHDLQHSLAEAQEDMDNLSHFDIFVQPSDSYICIICGEGFGTEEELMIHCALHADVMNDAEEVTMEAEKENGIGDPIFINVKEMNVVLAKKTFPKSFNKQTPPLIKKESKLFYEKPFQSIRQLNQTLTEKNIHGIDEPETLHRRRRKRKQTNITRNRCDQCKRIFSNSFSLKRHKSIIHLNKRPYSCTICRKTFIHMRMLTKHSLRHHAQNAEIFTCEYCREEFFERDLLHQHISDVHNMAYKCEACFMFFEEKEEHVSHMREHVVTYGFDCCRCRRRYKNDWELQRHRCIQEGPRPYLCKVCGKRFNRKYHLTRHFSVHQEIGGNVSYGVKIECDSEGEIEKPICLNPRKKLNNNTKQFAFNTKKLDFVSHYRNGRKTMLGKKMNYQCYICDVKWPNLRRYKQHFIMAHKKIRFNSCHICGKQFHTAYKVRRHLSSHDIPGKPKETKPLEIKPDPEVLQRDIKGITSKSFSDLEDNDIQDKERGGNYQCYICDENCLSLRRFKLHFKSQHKFVDFNSCHLCSKQFSTTQKLRQHLLSHDVKKIPVALQKETLTKDETSGIILYDDPRMAEFENVNTYGRGVRKTFLCYICKKNCLSYRRYKEHFSTEHCNVKLNACHLCNKQFTTTSKVKRHLQSHTHERNFQCHACGKKFAQLSHLKRHRVLMHTARSYRLRKCMHCPKMYADKASFEKHIYMHQLAEQSNFKCTVCNEKFVEERMLDEHILAFHDFFKKFQCPTCRRRFSHQSYLNRHLIIHSGFKQWKCFKCNKRFSTKSDLTRHSLTHTDLKPFPCFFCEKCFTRNSNRQKHISLFHDIRNVNVFDEDENDIKPFQGLTDKQKMVLMTYNLKTD